MTTLYVLRQKFFRSIKRKINEPLLNGGVEWFVDSLALALRNQETRDYGVNFCIEKISGRGIRFFNSKGEKCVVRKLYRVMVTDSSVCRGEYVFFLFMEKTRFYVLDFWPSKGQLPVRHTRCPRIELDLSTVTSEDLYITRQDMLDAWDGAFD